MLNVTFSIPQIIIGTKKLASPKWGESWALRHMHSLREIEIFNIEGFFAATDKTTKLFG